VSDGIFEEKLAGVRKFCREVAVNRRVAQRRAPGSLRKHGGIFAVRKMTNAENDDSLGKRDARENRTHDGTGIDVTSIRNQTGADVRAFGQSVMRDVLMNQRSQSVRLGGVESTGNGWQAKHFASEEL